MTDVVTGRQDERTATTQTDPHSHAYVADDVDTGVLTRTLVALTRQFAAAFSCSECCIYEYLPERNGLRAQAIWGRSLNDEDRAWIGPVHDLSAIPDFHRVITERELIVAYPEDEPDEPDPGPDTMGYWGEMAALWAPIVHGDDVVGLLELVEQRYRREFSREDRDLARNMADLAAIAVMNARASRTAEAHNRQLTALIESSRAMTSTLDLDEVLDTVCREAALALDTSCSYIYAYDGDDDSLMWLAQYQRDEDHVFEEPLGSVYPLADLPQDSAVVHSRRAVEVRMDDPDLDDTVREQLVEWGEQSSLMVPLTVADEVVGTLEVSETAWPRRFTPEESALCVALGEQAAVAIRNAEIYRTLQDQKATIERQATTDGLTGLLNHRRFWERLRDEVTRARRYDTPLSLMMLDLDDFKRVNDTCGHPAGDEVLRLVGETLRAQLRQGIDVAARYGGEEFAVILPHTESGPAGDRAHADGAVASAERIREALAQTGIAVRGAPQVTASIGVATFPGHAADAEGLVSSADQALYEAKNGGKDRVAVYAHRPATTATTTPRVEPCGDEA